jgi:elongation factor P--beta-lysine ligase
MDSRQSDSKETTMQKTYDVHLQVEEYANLYVGEEARALLQRDAVEQLEKWQAKAHGAAEGLDVSSLEACKELESALSFALGATKALVALTPPAEEPDE